MVNLHYINKAWLTIYCKQMRDYSGSQKPSLLLIAKDLEELTKVRILWEEVVKEIFNCDVKEIFLPCYGITEDNVKYHMKKNLLICGFTDFLISHDINDGFIINYLCKNIGRNNND